MGKKLTVILTFLLMSSICHKVLAQPNQYGDFQRAISDSRANAAYIEAIETQARTPNSAYKPVGIDKNVLNNFINIVKNNFNTGVPIRRSPEEIALIKKVNDEDIARKAAAQQQSDARDKIALPLYKYFLTLPITNNEAGRLSDISVRENGSLSDYYTDYFVLPQLVKLFNEKKETASLTELLSYVLQYEILPQSALTSLQYLQKRFPGEETLIELSMLKIIPRFYEYFSRGTDKGNRLFNMEADYKPVDDIFFRLAAKYPQVAAAMIYEIDPSYGPYSRQVKNLYKEKKNKEAYTLIKQYLELPAKNPVASMVSVDAGGYLDEVSLEEAQRLAALQKVPALTIVLGESAENSDLIHYLKYYTSFYQNKKVDLAYTKNKKQKLDRLGEEGSDSYAVLIYAIRTSLGYTKRNKDDAFELLKKAASMGNKEARWELDKNNLNNVCIWGLKSSREFCDAQRKELNR